MTFSYMAYSATGNTFLAIDAMGLHVPLSLREFWGKTADAHGVDGLLFALDSSQYDFRMRYLNRDGREVEMCGNGARAMGVFASELGISLRQGVYTFETVAGICRSRPIPPELFMEAPKDWDLIPVEDLFLGEWGNYINTGVPHCVYKVSDFESQNLMELAREIRHHPRFPEGVNITFVREWGKNYLVRTYERGVERETRSCGTGAAAAAVSLYGKECRMPPFDLYYPGGMLRVNWEGDYKNLSLTGEVEKLGSGQIVLNSQCTLNNIFQVKTPKISPRILLAKSAHSKERWVYSCKSSIANP